MAGVRLVRTVDAIAVDQTGTRGRQVAMPDLIGIFRQLDALELGLAIRVEQAQLDLGGVRLEQRKIDAEPVPCRAERKRFALSDHRTTQQLRCLREGAAGRCISHERVPPFGKGTPRRWRSSLKLRSRSSYAERDLQAAAWSPTIRNRTAGP